MRTGSFSSSKPDDATTSRGVRKETSYSRVISNYRLSDWLKKYCISPTSLFKSAVEREVFIDQHDIKRYVDNWQPVPVERDLEQLQNQTAESFFFQTGCMKFSHIYDHYRLWWLEQQEDEHPIHPTEDTITSDEKYNPHQTLIPPLPEQAPHDFHQIAYISEWQRLWVHLESNSDRDELSEYAPLFRLLIEFLFHPRLQTVMMLLLAYNYCINFILIVLFPSALPPVSIFFIFFELTVQTATYFAIVVVYKGLVTDPPESPFPFDELHPNNIIHNINSGFTNINSGIRESLRQFNDVTLQLQTNLLPPGANVENDHIAPMQPLQMRRGEIENHDDISVGEYYTNPMRTGDTGMTPRFTAETGRATTADRSTRIQSRVEITEITHSTNLYNHFRMIRKELVSRIKFELSRIHPLFARCFSLNAQKIQLEQKQTKYLRYRKRKRKLSYHEILNIALKFLVDVNQVNMKAINFDRRSYRFVLLFICLIYPLILFFSEYFNEFVLLPTKCQDSFTSNNHDESCRYLFYSLVFTLGSFTKYFVQLIFTMSVMVALVSLAYGAEIAYRLTDAWITKFKSLRRVEEYDMEEFLQMSLFKDNHHHLPSQYPLTPGNNPVSNSSMKRPLSPLKPKTNAVSIASSVQDIPIVSKRPFHFESEKNICEHPLYYWVRRDATEHYFFICEVFQAADKIWSPALTFIFVIGFGFSAIFVIAAFFDGSITEIYTLIQVIVYVSVRIFVLFVYPLMSLCHANSYIYELSNCFKRSSKDDFQLIGGCEQWIEFMENCPAAWTYNGLWITWDRLFGLIWTFAAAGLASGLGALFSLVSG